MKEEKKGEDYYIRILFKVNIEVMCTIFHRHSHSTSSVNFEGDRGSLLQQRGF